MNKSLSISKIKTLYPDEWVLIGDPEENNGELSGIVILHSKDKKELVAKASAQAGNIGFRKTILRFTGNPPSIGKWLKFTRLI